MEHLVSAFHKSAIRYPHNICLSDTDGKTFSYSEVQYLSSKVASFIIDSGFRMDDRIILSSRNSANFLITYLGIMQAGCTAVLVNPETFLASKDHIISTTGASDAIIGEDRSPDLPELLLDISVPLNQLQLPPLTSVIDSQRAAILYTSGTTSYPKGVVLTHKNLTFTAGSIIKWADIKECKRELTILPLTHLFGLAHFHCHFLQGSAFFIERSFQDPIKTFERIEKNEITHFAGTPGLFTYILDRFEDRFERCGKSLETVIINSCAIPSDTVTRLLECLPQTQIFMYYGLTEASRCTYINYNKNRTKLSTVGRPPSGVSVGILNGSNINQIATKAGEVVVMGENVFDSYVTDKVDDLFFNGWLKTGDTGFIDGDGFLTISGRLKKQINVDGFKCNPKEIEEVICELDFVDECLVYGMPHKYQCEQIAARIVLTNNCKNSDMENFKFLIRKNCKEKLGFKKVPEEITFVNQLSNKG